VQVGDIVLTNVPGSVIDVGKKELPVVLIGMSFLSHVEMQRSGNTMLLQRRDY
jgi:predicted aspartyl protease